MGVDPGGEAPGVKRDPDAASTTSPAVWFTKLCANRCTRQQGLLLLLSESSLPAATSPLMWAMSESSQALCLSAIWRMRG